MRSTARRSARAFMRRDRGGRSAWPMTRLLRVEKSAGRAASGRGPNGEAEAEASAKGVLDQGFRVGRGLRSLEEVTGEAGCDAVGMDHGDDSGRAQPPDSGR